MKRFMTVLKYELKEYFTNKVFMGLTVVLALLGAAALFLPRFIDMSGFTGVQMVGGGAGEEEDSDDTSGEQSLYLYVDQADILQEETLAQMFPGVLWQEAESADALRAAVEAQEAEAGFVVTGDTAYEYYVYNKSMMDTNTAVFDQAMKLSYRIAYSQARGWDLEEIAAMYDVPITVTEEILNKDSGSNYWYCYMLVIIVFMLIVYYGQMIAVSVTNRGFGHQHFLQQPAVRQGDSRGHRRRVPDGCDFGGRIAVLPGQQGAVGRHA